LSGVSWSCSDSGVSAKSRIWGREDIVRIVWKVEVGIEGGTKDVVSAGRREMVEESVTERNRIRGLGWVNEHKCCVVKVVKREQVGHNEDVGRLVLVVELS
jgi:hypothetical protein